MSNTAIWAISLIALTIIIIGLFTSLVNQGKEVPTGEMIPKLRRKNGQAGEMEEYTIPNPNFDDRLAPDPHTNPRYVTAMEPIMKTVYPNRGTGLMAILAVTAIVIGATFTLTHLNGEQGQTAQVAAEAKDTATNAISRADSAFSKAENAEGIATLTEAGLMKAYGTTWATNGERRIAIPNYNNALRKDAVEKLLAGIDQRITDESSARAQDVSRLDGRLNQLNSKLAVIDSNLSNVTNLLARLDESVAANGREVGALRTNQTAAVTASGEAARKIELLRSSLTNDLGRALNGARAEINQAVAEARSAANNRSLPLSVTQPMTVPRSDINLSYRRAGVFGKRSATLSYQATLNGRPDKETNIVALLEKFEKDHNTMIVKGLEEAASKKQHTNKDKAIVKLLDRVRADFNAWILGEWDFRRSGQAPQITDITITRWEVVNNDE